MNRIEQMLQELCPEGVEYKKLEDVGSLFGGLTGKNKEDFKEGNAKFVSYMNVYSNPALNLNIEEKVRISEGEDQNTIQYGDILFTGSSETPEECGMSSIVTQKVEEAVYLNSFCFGLRLNNIERFDVNFLKHLFRSDSIRKALQKTANGVTRFNVSKKRLLKIEIPVPPLEIQTRIAHILDHFTELAASLQAELQARKEQYEYYRNKLLTFDKLTGGGRPNVIWMKMSEVCEIKSGKNKSKSNIGTFPVYGSTGIIAFSDNYAYSETQILVARVGANAGYIHIATGKHDVSDNTLIINPQQWISLKFMFHILINLNLNRFTKGGGQPLITASDIKKLSIPIPPLSEQQRIASILDKFETLVNDLSQGLPAEIAAVQEQYEYYRNKLLTFKRAA